MTKKNAIIISVASLLGMEIAWKIWKYIRKRGGVGEIKCVKNKELIAPNSFEILMFTEDGKLCREHANTRIPCKKNDCPVGNVKKIQRYLSSASNTLDVCLYVITCDDLTNAIVRSHRRGACVRFIVDSGMSELTACSYQIMRMRRSGIEIRMNKLQPSSLMHHKFAVIDGKFVAFGSTNWTMQAFYGNNDSIVVTNSKECVEAYSSEFDKMWRNFDR